MKSLVWIILLLFGVCNVYQDFRLHYQEKEDLMLEHKLDSVSAQLDSLNDMYLMSVE